MNTTQYIRPQTINTEFQYGPKILRASFFLARHRFVRATSVFSEVITSRRPHYLSFLTHIRETSNYSKLTFRVQSVAVDTTVLVRAG